VLLLSNSNNFANADQKWSGHYKVVWRIVTLQFKDLFGKLEVLAGHPEAILVQMCRGSETRDFS
jgi:hypothetical protein